MTVNRLEPLERKLKKPPDLAKLYHDSISQIEEYKALRYALQLTKEEAKSHNASFNDDLLPGVDFLNNLASVLLRFREGRFAVIADIEKMFNQVRVRLKDTDALSFLWRANLE